MRLLTLMVALLAISAGPTMLDLAATGFGYNLGIEEEAFARGRSGGGSFRSSSGSFRSSSSRSSSSRSSIFSSTRSQSRQASQQRFTASATKQKAAMPANARTTAPGFTSTSTRTGTRPASATTRTQTTRPASQPKSRVAQRRTETRQNAESKKALDGLQAKRAAAGTKTVAPTRSTAQTNRYASSPVAGRLSPSDHRTMYSTKQATYGRYYSDPPIYVVNSGYSSFGMWDAMFMWALLDNNSGPGAHHYQNDAGYREFRAEADRLARDNDELRDKLAALDARTASAAGTPVDPNYLPKGVSAAAALAPDVIAATRTPAKICGAAEGGQYNAISNLLAASTDALALTVVPTKGTMENLDRIKAGTCDFAIVQDDGIDVWGDRNEVTGNYPFQEVASLFEEQTHLVCSRSSGVKGVRGLSGSNTIAIGPEGSGSAVTWASFGLEDDRYREVQTVEATTPADGILKVSSGRADCAFGVMALGSKAFRDADASASGGRLVLADVNDWDLNDVKGSGGERLYHFETLPRNTYPNLQSRHGAVKIVSLSANLIVSNTWMAANSEDYGRFQQDILATMPEITKRTTAPAARR